MNAESSSQQKVVTVLRDIALKNVQLRWLASVLLVDVEFLRICDTFDELQLVLLKASDDELDRFSIDSESQGVLSMLEQKVRKLQRFRSGCLQRIASYNDKRKEDEPEQQRRTFAERLEEALKQLYKTHRNFRRDVLNAGWRLGDIQLIDDFEFLLTQSDALHSVVCNNHRNCLRVLSFTNLDNTIELGCARLRLAANSQEVLALVQFCELLEKMDSTESVRTLHAKLQQEIRCSLNEIQVNEEELAALRQKLFTSKDSLSAQRTIAIEHRERQGIDLQEQLRTIDLLEEDRQEIEGRVTQLIEQREEIQRQLDERRQLLHNGMREIVRLERLIEELERQISDRKIHYQQEAQRLEQHRLDILNDETLSPEERAQLLADCDAEQQQLTLSHTSDINLLGARCDVLKRQSKNLAADVQAFRDEVAQKHRDHLEELERQKLLATTPSQLAFIEAQIQQQQNEFEENITMLGRAQARPEYLSDEHGRYFLNEAGERVYKRGSTASEYELGPDGTLIKVASAQGLQQDEQGSFFVDKFGQKIYQRQFFTDPQGEYYLDEHGKRVYSVTHEEKSSYAASESMSSGQQQFGYPTTRSPTSSASEDDDLESSDSIQDLRSRIASDITYVQNTVGVVLRKGLAFVARAKPDDPVGYLSDYLALYRRNGLETQQRQQLLERLGLENTEGCLG